MSIDIFRLDWILIDTIIILLLLVFFVVVKLFKWKNRWRNELSNISLKKQALPTNNIIADTSNPSINGFNLVYSKVDSGEKSNLIFIRDKSDKLTQILLEGIATYGNKVLEIIVDSKRIYEDIQDLYPRIRSFIESNKENFSLGSETYILLNQVPLTPTFDLHFFKPISEKIILINPEITGIFLRTLQSRDLIMTLLETSILVFNKKKFNKFKTKLKKVDIAYQVSSENTNILVINNCNKQFKYRETVLLSGILKIINSK
ncbi:MAG: hypothetical protein GF383_02780 [Candidatus Lokiarchaeota archaeon]|nr:hypothetical protein [Candidatus Lokiarchaeota archaeon]MBD3338414.1 hypothetical protein [Candidatus Lokiarchaeota archaeon]